VKFGYPRGAGRRGFFAAVVLVGAVVIGSATVGCSKAPAAPGKRVACTCTFLTDFDDAARVDVDVCAANGKNVVDEAKACAARSAHNHVEGCVCQPPTSEAPCDASARDACDAH
jgi:hypothetical protein